MNDIGWMESWLFRTLAAGGVVFLSAWAVLLFTADPARRQRLAAWSFRAALLAAVLGAFPAWLKIPVESETPAVAASPPRYPLPPPVEDFALPEVVRPLPTVAAAIVANDMKETIAKPIPWRTLAIRVYCGIALLAVAHLTIAFLALARLRKSSSPVPGYVEEVASHMANNFGVSPAVRVSPRIASPLCFGWRRPVVLLPTSLVDSTKPDELRWALAHEFDHLRRGDPFTGLCVGLARALYFAVPWFWLVRKELCLAQEYLADAAAASGRPAEYAAFLVSLSNSPARRRPPLGAMAAWAGRSDLYRRVSMLTQGSKNVRDGVSRKWSLLTAGGALALAIAASGVGFAEAGQAKPAEVKKAADTPEDLPTLSKAVDTALAKGDIDAAKDAMAKLHRAVERLEAKNRELPPLSSEASKPVPTIMPPRLPATPKPVPTDDANALRVFALRYVAAADAALTLQDLFRKNADSGLSGDMRINVEAVSNTLLIHASPADMRRVEKAVAKLDAPTLPPRIEAPSTNGSPGEERLGLCVRSTTYALRDQLDLPDGVGVVLHSLTTGAPAEKAGIVPADVLLAIDGKPVPDKVEDAVRLLDSLKPGSKFDILVLRKGKRTTVKDVALPAPVKRTSVEHRPVAWEQKIITIKDGKFTINATNENRRIRILGKVVDGRPVVEIVEGLVDGTRFMIEGLPENGTADRGVVDALLAGVAAEIK